MWKSSNLLISTFTIYSDVQSTICSFDPYCCRGSFKSPLVFMCVCLWNYDHLPRALLSVVVVATVQTWTHCGVRFLSSVSGRQWQQLKQQKTFSMWRFLLQIHTSHHSGLNLRIPTPSRGHHSFKRGSLWIYFYLYINMLQHLINFYEDCIYYIYLFVNLPEKCFKSV